MIPVRTWRDTKRRIDPTRAIIHFLRWNENIAPISPPTIPRIPMMARMAMPPPNIPKRPKPPRDPKRLARITLAIKRSRLTRRPRIQKTPAIVGLAVRGPVAPPIGAVGIPGCGIGIAGVAILSTPRDKLREQYKKQWV